MKRVVHLSSIEARGGVIVLPKPIDEALSIGVLMGTLWSEKRGLGKLAKSTDTLMPSVYRPRPSSASTLPYSDLSSATWRIVSRSKTAYIDFFLREVVSKRPHVAWGIFKFTVILEQIDHEPKIKSLLLSLLFIHQGQPQKITASFFELERLWIHLAFRILFLSIFCWYLRLFILTIRLELSSCSRLRIWSFKVSVLVV